VKEGFQGVSVALLSEHVNRLDRLPPRNRTRSIADAVELFLDVQDGPVGQNAYGVDTHYYRGKLRKLIRDMGSYTPQELHNSLKVLAMTAGAAYAADGVEDEKV